MKSSKRMSTAYMFVVYDIGQSCNNIMANIKRKLSCGQLGYKPNILPMFLMNTKYICSKHLKFR